MPSSKSPSSQRGDSSHSRYSTSTLWTDVVPIPQIDLDLDLDDESSSTKMPSVPTARTGPALATILYPPRYTEAMSYLRAVMAANEYSDRVLALTEDVISMNAAHYTVWLYRFRVLRELWGVIPKEEGMDKKQGEVGYERIVAGVREELKWLEGISEKHLKNYQIWQHRHSLVSLLKSPPPPGFITRELRFLSHILSFDAKNYHVWTYRQWLCTKFPDLLLSGPTELANTADMLAVDVRNNSAWSHRYFVAFGYKELLSGSTSTSASTSTSTSPQQQQQQQQQQHKRRQPKVVDLDVVDREIAFVQTQIRRAPQNVSSWNYMRGVARHADMKWSDFRAFAEEFVGPECDFYTELPDRIDEDEDEDNDINGDKSKGKGVRSSYAIELLIDVFDDKANNENDDDNDSEHARRKVREGLDALSSKWDPIRKKYWAYRLKQYEQKWKEQDAERLAS